MDKLILGVIATALVYLLKYFFDKRKEAESIRIAFRREHYRNLLLCLKSLSEGRRDNDELLRFEYVFLWLYAPDAVINPFNDLLRRISRQNDTQIVEVGELILAMRRDLGFKNTRLLASDFELLRKTEG